MQVFSLENFPLYSVQALHGASLLFCVIIGDVELSSMVAGLAVGKPGDTTSISADSALGRSSVITGTTAGVTQFSEVSQITDWAVLMSHIPFPGSGRQRIR